MNHEPRVVDGITIFREYSAERFETRVAFRKPVNGEVKTILGEPYQHIVALRPDAFERTQLDNHVISEYEKARKLFWQMEIDGWTLL